MNVTCSTWLTVVLMPACPHMLAMAWISLRRRGSVMVASAICDRAAVVGGGLGHELLGLGQVVGGVAVVGGPVGRPGGKRLRLGLAMPAPKSLTSSSTSVAWARAWRTRGSLVGSTVVLRMMKSMSPCPTDGVPHHLVAGVVAAGRGWRWGRA